MTLIDVLLLIIGIAFGAAGTAWLTARFDLKRANFRGARIPACGGLVFVLAAAFTYGVSWFLDGAHPGSKAAYILCVVGFGLLGFWDDVKGDRSVGGFRGHLGALAKGKITTGFIKLLGGGIISAAAALMLWYPFWSHCLVAFLLIPLMANTINLLDLRPGRSLAAFFLFAMAIFAYLAKQDDLPIGYFLYIAIAIAVFLYPLDSTGQIMLGDTGANAFGAVLGVAMVLYFPLWGQIAVVVALVAFNVWCEKYSFSKTIENNKILRGIDRKIGVR